METRDIEPKSLSEWFEGRELPLTLAVCLFTGLIGYLVHHGLASLILAGVEFFAGTAWWLVRRVLRFCDGLVEELGKGAGKLEEICGILAQRAEMEGVIAGQHDARIVASLRDISYSASQLLEHPHLQFFVQHALDNTAQFSSSLANRTPVVLRPKSEGDQVQRTVQTYIRGLPPNFIYQTLTTLAFWCDGLITNPLTMLQMNISAATLKSGKFIRVILVEKASNELTSNEWRTLETHFAYTASNPHLIETRILRVPKSQMESFGHFVISRSTLAPFESLLLDLHYTMDGKVERLEFVRKQDLIEERAEIFRMAYNSAVPIAEFLNNKPLLAA